MLDRDEVERIRAASGPAIAELCRVYLAVLDAPTGEAHGEYCD